MTLNLTAEKPSYPGLTPRITVIGVGGAGTNAVDNMIDLNLQGVEFIAANTDAQQLSHSRAGTRIQLGPHLTQGLGAGAKPEIGEAAAEEAADEIYRHLEGVQMVFITAGMGGGTGTGAAPVIARMAREKNILVVGVVTRPFDFEGRRRAEAAERGVAKLQHHVDTLLVIPNQNLSRLANEKTGWQEAFKMADNVLYMGVRGITDLMTSKGLINLDFNDVRAVMQANGTAMMGTGEAEGEDRALRAAEAAISNPLLESCSMQGARGLLINISGGDDLTLHEVTQAGNRISNEVDPDAVILFGSAVDPALEGRIRVSIVATGLGSQQASEMHTPPLFVVAGGRAMEVGGATAQFRMDQARTEGASISVMQPEAVAAPQPVLLHPEPMASPVITAPIARGLGPAAELLPTAQPVAPTAANRPIPTPRNPNSLFMRVTRRLRGQDAAPERSASVRGTLENVDEPPRRPIVAEVERLHTEIRVEPRPQARPIASGTEEMFEIPSFLRRQNS